MPRVTGVGVVTAMQRHGLEDVVPSDPTGSVLSHVHAEMYRGLLVQVPYIAVFCGVAYWWFARKDITS